MTVTYPGRTTPALDRFDLVIPERGVVALVGATGAGKSTAANLLLRFIEPDAGSILVGGVPLASIDLAAWRAHVAWVPQRPYLFHGSVADNIRLARPDASDEALRDAAQEAGADTFIAALSRGYETSVGEDGTRLSGGQRQRIALLARSSPGLGWSSSTRRHRISMRRARPSSATRSSGSGATGRC